MIAKRASVQIPTGLSGARGLLAAVMSRAVLDLDSSDTATAATALEYFGSDIFVDHLLLCDLDPDLFPEVSHGNND